MRSTLQFDYRQIFRGLLSQDEARALIALGRNIGFRAADPAYPPAYRNNERVVIDDPQRADWLFGRLAPRLPTRIVDSNGDAWTLCCLNPRFRSCRYRAGQSFSLHRDGAHHEGANKRSFFTVMLYLNDASEFSGGTTRFYDSKLGPICFEVTPERGAAIVFSHRWWHDGSEVTGGEKLIMRTDVMYERETPRPGRGHNGYVWCLAQLADGRIASGGRDKTIRVWKGSECVDVIEGHELSVTCLGARGSSELVSGSRDGTLRLFRKDRAFRHVRTARAHHGVVLKVLALDDGRFISAGADGTVRESGPLFEELTSQRIHEGWIWDLSLAPDGRLVTVSEDGVIRWGGTTADTKAPVRAAVFSGRWLLTGSADGEISRWNQQLEVVARWQAHDGAITSLVNLGDNWIASAAEDNRVFGWGLNGVRREPEIRHDDFVRALLLTRNRSLISASYDGTLCRTPLGP